MRRRKGNRKKTALNPNPTNTAAAAATATFSDLPENVLIQIISYLPIKDAIATSFLSKAWRNLWTYSSNLIFDSNLIYDSSTSFVDQALQRHHLSNLRLLHINLTSNDEGLAPHIDRWILIVAENNIQNLDLNLVRGSQASEYPHYNLSFSLLRSATLNILKLARCRLLPSTGAGFRSLRTLFLEDVELTDQTIPDLVGGCPELENLTMRSCEGIKHLKIASTRLKNLCIWYCLWSSSVEIDAPNLISSSSVEIDAPNLISFTCHDCRAGEFRFKDISSLVDAFVFFDEPTFFDNSGEPCFDPWRQIVESLTPARRITIDGWRGELMPLKTQHHQYHAKFLELGTGFTKVNFLGLAMLLQHSPRLETVIVDMDSFIDDDEGYKEKFLDEHFLHFNLPQLKVFRIGSYRESKKQSEMEIELVKFLLKYGTALEEVILICGRSEFLCKRLEELQTFPRSSVHAKISLVDLFGDCRDSVRMQKYDPLDCSTRKICMSLSPF